MNDVSMWLEPTRPEVVEGSLVSGVPQEDAENVNRVYEDILEDPTVHAVLTNGMTADNISQVAALNGTVGGSSASRLAAAEQGAGDVADSYPHIPFSSSRAQAETEEPADVTFARHLLVDWKKRMYMSVQESFVKLINEYTVELWKNEDGRKWLNGGVCPSPDNPPPIIDVDGLQEPVLGGLEADSITQEELLAFQNDDVDRLTAYWMQEWCGHGRDFALGGIREEADRSEGEAGTAQSARS